MTEMEDKNMVKTNWNLHRWLIGLILVVVITVTAVAGALAYWRDGANWAMLRPGIRPDDSPVVSPGSAMVEETVSLLAISVRILLKVFDRDINISLPFPAGRYSQITRRILPQ